MENLEELLAEARKRYHTIGMKIKSKHTIQGTLDDPPLETQLAGLDFRVYANKTIVEWNTSGALWCKGEWAETHPEYVDELEEALKIIYTD